jgi:predicted nucleic-acid-binding protein
VKALDTNVLVRYYAKDDAEQFQRAFATLRDEPRLFVPRTVILELFWVLTRVPAYSFPADKALAVIDHLMRLPNITVEDAGILDAALGWARLGVEFQDALHLAASRGCSVMLTFDRPFRRRVTRTGIEPTCVEPASGGPEDV